MQRLLEAGYPAEAGSAEMLAAVFTLPDVATVVIVGVPLFLKPALIAGIGVAAHVVHTIASNCSRVYFHDGLLESNSRNMMPSILRRPSCVIR